MWVFTSYGEENGWSDTFTAAIEQREPLAAAAPYSALIFFFLYTISCSSCDEFVKLFKLTDNGAIVGLITDNESLCISSFGSTVVRHSIQNNLLFHLNYEKRKLQTRRET